MSDDQLLIVHTRLRVPGDFDQTPWHRKIEAVRLYFAGSAANASKGELSDWKSQDVKIPADISTVPWPPSAYCSAVSKTQWWFTFVEQKIVHGWFQQGVNVWRFGLHGALESKESVIAIDTKRDFQNNLDRLNKEDADRHYQPTSCTMVKDQLYVSSVLGEVKPEVDTMWSKRILENNVVKHKHLQKQFDASKNCVCTVLDGSTDAIKYVHVLAHNPSTHEVFINTMSKETFPTIVDDTGGASWTSTKIKITGDQEHLWYGPGVETLPIQGVITTDTKTKDRRLYIFFILNGMNSNICYSYVNLTSDGFVKTHANGEATAHGPSSVPKTDMKRFATSNNQQWSLRGNFRVCTFAGRIWVFFTALDHSCMYSTVPVEPDGSIDFSKWRHEPGDKINNFADLKDNSIVHLYEPIVVGKDMLPAMD